MKIAYCDRCKREIGHCFEEVNNGQKPFTPIFKIKYTTFGVRNRNIDLCHEFSKELFKWVFGPKGGDSYESNRLNPERKIHR